MDAVLRRRIARHHLGADKGGSVIDVARRVGGSHAQVASSAQAAADLRLTSLPDLTDAHQGWISPTLVINGRIERVWEESPDGVRVSPFGKLPASAKRALPAGATIV